MTKIQKIWLAMNQRKKRRTANSENQSEIPNEPSENQNAATEFDENTLRFLHSAEFVLNTDGKSYTAVYNGSDAVFKDGGLVFN